MKDNKIKAIQKLCAVLIQRSKEIYITDDDIAHAERRLGMVGKFTISPNDEEWLKETKKERIDFIKNLKTIDVDAVPGSGKTTALLMKLAILEKKLPLSGGRGVLVISHTNNAIDEIKNKLQPIVPRLFEYPNFIGTIQSFVNKFLAKPYYIKVFGSKVVSIDSNNYINEIKRFINSKSPWVYTKNLSKEYSNIILSLKEAKPAMFYDFKFGVKDAEVVLVDSFKKNKILEIIKIKGKAKKYEDYTKKEKRVAYNWFFKFKSNILEKGVLHYDDAYFLANRYVLKYPVIKELIQKRFKYVFVDEMQDMEKHQHDLLEELFINANDVIYQQIGDANQSIYGSSVSAENTWKPKVNSLTLQGSFRLTPEITNIVKYFAIDFREIQGLRESYKSQESSEYLKPHILVYKTGEEEKVLKKYAELIEECGLNTLDGFDKYKKNRKHPFYAIGWVGKDRKDGEEWKENVKTFYQPYNHSSGKENKKINSVVDLVTSIDKELKTMKSFVSTVFNILVAVLRLQEIKNVNTNRFYTKTQLQKELYENTTLDIKGNILSWSRLSGADRVKNIKDFILSTSFRDVFLQENENWNKDVIEFLNNEEVSSPGEHKFDQDETNIFKCENGTEIKVGTVHSVKGSTHMATLYMESFYRTGNNQHEFTRLKPQFHGVEFNSNKKYTIESAKMVYVGFSRPTHLLCFAVNEERCDDKTIQLLKGTDRWKIIKC